jgi:hypothetical protein
MSLAEAENFYAAVLPALQQAFKDSFADSLGDLIEEHFDTRLTPQERVAFGEVAGPIMGRKHWERLIHFMSGRNPSETARDESAHAEPGAETLLALVFEGPSAVGRIRALLGSTDPSQAPVGTVRREFGQTMMINAAHASDSAENAAREIGLLRIGRNDLTPLIEAWYRQPAPDPDRRGHDREANASPPRPSLTFPQ